MRREGEWERRWWRGRRGRWKRKKVNLDFLVDLSFVGIISWAAAV